MSDAPKADNEKSTGRLLSRLIVALLALLLLIVVAIRLYLATPYPAEQLSKLVSAQLQQKFTVKELDFAGTTLILKGISLKNPDGFPAGELVRADSVTIAPQWGNLLRGKQRFRQIALRGITINLEKDARGAWNFGQLQRLAAAKKKPGVEPAETFIGELVVEDGSLKVQGQGVQGIALQVFNLTTTGSADSRVDLAFEDAARNRYSLKGKARAGQDAALDLTLSAPSLSLQDVAQLLKLKNPAPLQGAKGALAVSATLQKGDFAAKGDFSFRQIQLPTAGKAYPVQGLLHFDADYQSRTDTARLRGATLTVEKLVQLQAQGSVRGLKKERDFSLQLAMDQVDLALFNTLVPEKTRKGVLVRGKLSCDSLRLAGDGRRGVTSAAGTLKLKEGALAQKERLIAAGLSATIAVSRQQSALAAQGKVSVAGRHQGALLETLDLPFSLLLSPKLKLIRAEVPAFSASVLDIPVKGRIAYHAAAATPISASLEVPGARVAALNGLLKRHDLQAASGTASATLEIAGKGAQEFDATAHLKLADLHGTHGKDSFAAKKGSVAAEVRKSGTRLLAQGDLTLSGLTLNGKSADLRSAYRFADGAIQLDRAELSLAGTTISVAQLTTRLPAKQTAGGFTRYPLSAEVSGVALKKGDLELGNLSGGLRGSFNSDGSSKWLEGTVDLDSKAVNWQGKTLAAPVIHAAFARSGGKAELSGAVLGGKLAGSASFNPFAPEAGASFDLAVSGAKLAAAAPLLPPKAAVRPSDGAVDLKVNGSYSGRGGLSCRFETKGSGIALTGNGGKALVSGAELALAGALAGEKLTIDQAVLAPGQGVALRLKGELNQALSPKREGRFTFTMPEASLNNLVDPFANILPRLLQEATVDGTIAADGKIELRAGSSLVQGGVTFKGGRLEVESQKFLVSDLNGRFPFSLDLAGKQGGKPDQFMAFSRENYPRILEQMRKAPGGGEKISVAKISFGALELGPVTMRVSAGNGLTEIPSLTVSLYEGAILGRGFFSIRQQPSFRGDLLINGVSLRQLCRALPIEGYIAGRVDGVVSVSGAGGGLKQMTGFAELWARPGGGEKMVVSKEFLQRLAKQKLSGFFFSTDRPYDQAEIKAMLEQGDLTFHTLKIINTNPFGVRDLNVSIAPGQNRIALDHLLESIKEAAVRGKKGAGEVPGQAPTAQEFKWGE